MLTVILVTAAAFAVILCGGWLTVEAMMGRRNTKLFGIAAFVYWSILIGAFVHTVAQKTQTGPCVTWETQMLYNPTLKMLAPARVCTLRGEWVE